MSPSNARRNHQVRSQSDGRLHDAPRLLPHHEKQLFEDSAIDPAVAEERGVRSIEDAKELGHFPAAVQALVPGIHFPTWTVEAEPGSPQYRPDKPRGDKRKPGKVNKYENQYRARIRLDIHPRNIHAISDATVPLYITEGIKKADAGTSRGLCVIALVGVDCWSRNGEPLKDWDSVELDSRLLRLAFDSDLMEKKEVRRALLRLKRFLGSRGATVEVIHFEAAFNEKVGLDDYFAAGGTVDGLDALVKPLAGAVEGEIIDLTDMHLGEKVDKALAFLEDANERLHIYQRAGVLVEPSPEEGFLAIKPDRMLYLLGRAPFYQERKDGSLGKCDPPDRVISALLNAREVWPFPVLNRVIRSPVFNADGSVHAEPGYHEPTGTLYIPQPGLAPIPYLEVEEPDDLLVRRARNLLLELFCDFPFSGDADRAAAVALLIEPFIRALIDGYTPLYGIDAHTPGSGKGKVAEAALIPSHGHADGIPSYSDVTSDAEMRKKITTAVLAGRQVFFLDNVSYRLAYSSLASALTRPHGDRVLGVNKDVNIRLRWTWMATGNHLKYSDEIERRTVPIFLDSKDENPHLRTNFKHPDLGAWALENRHRLIGAVIVVVRRWLTADKPPASDAVPAFGSFDAYRENMGGILETAGVGGFLRNVAGVESVMSERELLAVFLRVAREVSGEKPFGVQQVSGWPIASELSPDADHWTRAFDTRLGIWLSNHVGRPSGGYRLMRAGLNQATGSALYKVETI